MFIVDDLLLGVPFFVLAIRALFKKDSVSDANDNGDGSDFAACRAAVPAISGLVPTNAGRGGYYYSGKNPALLSYLQGYLSSVSAASSSPRSVLAFSALLPREGSTSAINTYDSQLFTWGVGWGGLGGLPRVMDNLAQAAASDSTLMDALAHCGVWYTGQGDWTVLDDSGNVVSGKQEALEVIRSSPALLNLFIHLAEDPATRDAVADAQLQAFLATSGNVPAGATIATQALYNLVTHLQHWAPAYMTGVLETAAQATPGPPSAERDRALAAQVVQGFYARAAGHGWTPSWSQMQGYVLKDMRADGLDVGADPVLTASTPPTGDTSDDKTAGGARKTAGGCGSNWASFKRVGGPGHPHDPFAPDYPKTAGGCGNLDYPDATSVCGSWGPWANTYFPSGDQTPAAVKVVSGPGNADPRFGMMHPSAQVDPRMMGQQPPGYAGAYEVFVEPDVIGLAGVRTAGGPAGPHVQPPHVRPPPGSGWGETYDPRDPYRALRRASGPATTPSTNVVPTAEQVATVKRGIAAAVTNGDMDDPTWTQVTVGPDASGVSYDVMVTNEPLAVGGLRLPTSYRDAITVANLMHALPITPAVSDVRWATMLKVPAQPLNDPKGAIMNDPGQVVRYNARIGPNDGQPKDGYWKELVLVPGLATSGPRSMAQYGFRLADGTMYEHGGPSNHDALYKDYSDTPTYMGRTATRHDPDGSTTTVDLLDELAGATAFGPPIEAWLLDKFRTPAGAGGDST